MVSTGFRPSLSQPLAKGRFTQGIPQKIHPQDSLRNFNVTKHFFIGIDSDGCAFDTMEVKHKECFIPNIVRFFRLAAVSKYLREVAEFVNLYSQWRGINRFPGLTLTLDLLAERPEIASREFIVPRLTGLRQWLDSETKLANTTLLARVQATNDPDLAIAYEWSEAVNRTIGDLVHDVPPFPFVRESLQSMIGKADVMVVSATPGEALNREWEEHGLKRFVSLIAGQELGSKKEHLALAATGRYDPEKVLMVGDAPGDLKAAEANGALFFPSTRPRGGIVRRFHDEALPRFFAGTYAGQYMADRIARFKSLLPEIPWQRT